MPLEDPGESARLAVYAEDDLVRVFGVVGVLHDARAVHRKVVLRVRKELLPAVDKENGPGL